jgi:hypothetical protein
MKHLLHHIAVHMYLFCTRPLFFLEWVQTGVMFITFACGRRCCIDCVSVLMNALMCSTGKRYFASKLLCCNLLR